MVLEEGLRRHLNLQAMGSVRGAFQMVVQPQSLGLAVIDVGDPNLGATSVLPPEPIYFGYSYYQRQ